MTIRTLAFALLLPTAGLASSPVTVWQMDSLVKVRPDSVPASTRAAKQDWLLARNGHLNLQFAVRGESGIQALDVQVILPKELTSQVRRVGYVPVKANPPDSPAKELIGSAPGLFPDPLLEDLPFELPAAQTTAVWLTLFAPGGTPPGLYKGSASFRAGGKTIAQIPFRIRVVAASVPARQSLKVTNWLNTDEKQLSRYYDLSSSPDRYWQVMGNIAGVLAEHRQNVILTPIFELTEASVVNGAITYDFSRLDRWVETFDKAGAAQVIEGGHLLGRVSGYNSPLTVAAFVVEDGAVKRAVLDPADPRAEAHLRSYLPALHAHLKQKGWDGKYVQHVLDEAHGTEPPVYLRYVEIIRQSLPGIPTIDAIDQTAGLLGEACDIWVPQLGRFDDGLDSINQHVRQGKEAWFYTCLYPQGTYLNRFIQQPLLKTRLLHWLNYRYGFTGYLHWGGNYWTDDPLNNVDASIPSGDGKMELLPAGDAFITYPWREKSTIHSSIRLEAMRDGIEDYELLVALGKKDPAKAAALAGQTIQSLSSAIGDVDAFRRIQAELLAAAGE
jgi:hypothetical protein